MKNQKIIRLILITGLCTFFDFVQSPLVYASDSYTQSPVVQQSKKITGRVSDSMGPLIGATVRVKGTSNGVVTDLDGKFVIEASSNATLVVSYVGYVTQEISIGAKSNLGILLSEERSSIKEVVVIGYGTQRKEAVTGSVSNFR